MFGFLSQSSQLAIDWMHSCCGMYVPLSDDKHWKVWENSKSALEIQDKFSPRQNAVQDKIQSENFFLMVRIFFFKLNVVSDCICLGLNFVSDYIPQLYFVCNLLIFKCTHTPCFFWILHNCCSRHINEASNRCVYLTYRIDIVSHQFRLNFKI